MIYNIEFETLPREALEAHSAPPPKQRSKGFTPRFHSTAASSMRPVSHRPESKGWRTLSGSFYHET